jgi:enterochelin esterase family protein
VLEPPTGQAQFDFRGNAAPPAPAVAKPLRGTLSNVEVPSRFLPAPKQVTVYLPPGKRKGALPALYMTDGISVANFAPIVEALTVAGRIRPIAIVGEHAGVTAIDLSRPYHPSQDQRSREYLAGIDPVVFERHMRFFIEELLPWAEKQYGLSIARRDRAAMGYSSGGAFVASLGLQHPQVFFTVMPFSPAGSPFGSSETATDPAQMPRFPFAAGELESPFLANARANSAWLKARGVANSLRAYWSGHDILQWQQALADYLPEVFPAKAR